MSASADKTYLSRPLLMAWCCWLLGSWMVNLDIDAPRWISEDALTPAARGMFISMMIGLGLIWPAWRLSLPLAPGASPGMQTATDAISLLAIAQLVVWPLRALLGWPLALAQLVDMALVAWTGVAGLCVWGGLLGRSPGSRTAGMAMATALMFGGPLLGVLTGSAEAARWSSLHVLWSVGNGGVSVDEASAMTARLAVVAGAGVVAGAVMHWRFRPDEATGI